MFFFLFFALHLLANGQTARNRASFPEPLRSPVVTAGGEVTYRLSAPGARTVLLARDGTTPKEMTRDTAGVWSYTETLSPDIYPYTFVVDGALQPDPNNPLLKPVFRTALGQSLVHVPGPDTLSWEVADVPHGSLTQHFYKSGIVGDQRDFWVYTPPGYDAKRKEAYPVLYLLHGFTDEASAWTRAGRAHVIVDNLIAQGKIKPMLVVNTLGYGVPTIVDKGFGGLTPELMQKNGELFIASLLQEVIPQVEKSYHTRKDKDGRAVAGLSMGGGQALSAGLNNPQLFSYVGGFSSAVVMLNPDYNKAFPALDASANKQLKLVWIACGTEDFLIEPNRKYKNWLMEKGVRHTYLETPGGHTWMVWRRYLTDFLPLLFR
jgi:enterochelin esterase family protein